MAYVCICVNKTVFRGVTLDTTLLKISIGESSNSEW